MFRFDEEKLIAHPEGGRFLEIFRSSQAVQNASETRRSALTHIYFSLAPGEASRFHKVASDEVWNLYQGAVVLYVWDDVAEALKSYELSASSRIYCVVVEAGKWQAAMPLDGDVVVGCSVAPGFEFDDFSLIDPEGDIAARILKNNPELLNLI